MLYTPEPLGLPDYVPAEVADVIETRYRRKEVDICRRLRYCALIPVIGIEAEVFDALPEDRRRDILRAGLIHHALILAAHAETGRPVEPLKATPVPPHPSPKRQRPKGPKVGTTPYRVQCACGNCDNWLPSTRAPQVRYVEGHEPKPKPKPKPKPRRQERRP